MKKMFLLLPVGLLAATGLVWVGTNSVSQQSSAPSVRALSQNPEELFSLSQNSLRQIIRHGDDTAMPILQKSLDALETTLVKYEEHGLSVGKAEGLIDQYIRDSSQIAQASAPYLQKLKIYDTFEREKEAEFIRSLEQIGLNELMSANTKLNKKRLEYMKEPSLENEQKYLELVSEMKKMITELYLDSTIEEPLFAYIENHSHYFKTVESFYTEAGIERVHRLRVNSYAIKTELQLLPKL